MTMFLWVGRKPDVQETWQAQPDAATDLGEKACEQIS